MNRMVKMIELRTLITGRLKSIHPRVYYQQAPDDAPYPYLVYDLPNSTDDGSMERFMLDVDGWDAPLNGDETALETLMSNVDAKMHRHTFYVTGLSATTYRENRLPLRDDDKRIRRRKYIYQLRVFEGGS